MVLVICLLGYGSSKLIDLRNSAEGSSEKVQPKAQRPQVESRHPEE
jgi:hypothetical protein